MKVDWFGRVLRGGSWNNNGRNARSANRNRNEPDNRNDNIGFRLALARTSADASFDQTDILSAIVRQKENALRCVSSPVRSPARKPAEAAPKTRTITVITATVSSHESR